jgi:DNA-binding NtrC family response regulator
MLRLALYSKDSRLQSVLALALGGDYSVLVESSKETIRRIVDEERLDVLMLDLDSNYGSIEDQLGFFDEMRDSRIPVVVMTDDQRRSTAMELVQWGVYDYFRKPPSLPELKIVVRRAHEHSVLKRELEETRETLRAATRCDRLVGCSGRGQVVYDLIRRVADLDAFVLITGESGTGKELVARAIHNLSHRAQAPFVAVSCGAIPDTLIEAELFGHEKGAFTGTCGARAGHMEQAGNGTLFLDEIGELSLPTQVKLLRVLQQREFSRLGTNKLIPLKAHVLFATHRNLPRMVEEGAFRQDLFYRVNVMRINVPPLRERTEDIPILAGHFLNQYAAAYRKPVREIRSNAMALLLEYDWPGNVRELENAIQSAVILAEGDSIEAENLPEILQPRALMSSDTQMLSGSFEDQLREYKTTLAKRAVHECNGNKTLAARNLSISRAYLHRLIRIPEEDISTGDINAA